MKFDKLVYRETKRPGRELRVTVDFGIGEITAQSAPDGEIMWRRLAGPCGTVLRMKLAECDFAAWEEVDAARNADGSGWSLELSSDGRPAMRLGGDGDAPMRRPAFASVIGMCFALAENRSSERRGASPAAEQCAAFR